MKNDKMGKWNVHINAGVPISLTLTIQGKGKKEKVNGRINISCLCF